MFLVEALLSDVEEEEVLSCEPGDSLLYGSLSSVGVPLMRKSASFPSALRSKFVEGISEKFHNGFDRDEGLGERLLTTRYISSNEVNKPFIFSAYFVSHK